MNTLYIVSENEKHLLEEYRKNNPLLNFDIMLDRELKTGLLGKINDSAIIYLSSKGYSFSNAKKISKVLVPLKEVTTFTIDFKKLYEECLKKGYIEKENYFVEYLKTKKIILSPLCDNSEIKYLLRDFSYTVEKINKNISSREIYFFDELKEACESLYAIIYTKIKEGIDIKNIKIASSSNEFVDIVKTYNRFYRFPICFERKIKKNKTEGYKKLVSLLKEKTLKEALYELKEDELIGELISIYISLKDNFSDDEIIRYISFYVESEKTIKEKGAIEFVDKYYIPKKGEVLIVPSFVSSVYPCPLKDDTFPGDNEFLKAHVLTSKEKNKLEFVKFEEVYQAPGEVIFLKFKFFNKREYYPSIFEDTFSFETKQIEPLMLTKRICDIKLSNFEDEKLLYGKTNFYKKQLDDQVKEYRLYDHSFKPFSSVKRQDIMNISYSKLSTYLDCPFKYYLSNVLKLDPFEDTEFTRKGNVFHKYIQDRSLGNEVDLNEYINSVDDPREKYLIKRSFPSVTKAYELHEVFLKNSSFDFEKPEYEFNVIINEKIKLNGRVDCLLIDEKNKFVSVIDYKTSGKNFDKELVAIGENLQLPVYLLLLSKDLKDYTPIGAYISNLLSEKYLRNGDLSEFNLNGVTRLEERYLSSMGGITYLSGVSRDKEGNIKESKRIVNEQEMEELIKTALDFIVLVSNSICEGDFRINPKVISGKSSCEYCSFKDICYKEDSDDRILIKKLEEDK